jgi:hypothetical protein
MQAERWQQIEKLFHSVLDMVTEERAAFLQQACQGDEALRLEVERRMANRILSNTVAAPLLGLALAPES